MNKKLVLDKILKYFIKNEKDIPSELKEKIKLWKEIISTYDLSKVPSDILEAEDKFLKYELLGRKLTNGEKVKNIGSELVKNIKYGDVICLWSGDETQIFVDAVVHVTSVDKLLNDKKKADDIVLRSGMRLKKKCRAAVPDGKLDVAETIITRAFNLPCDYILHVIEPDGRSKNYDENVKKVYENVLICAKNNMIRSVVIPCVGIHRKDSGKYIDIMLDAINEFMDKYNEIAEMRIIMNIPKKHIENVKKKLMKRVIK